MEAAATIWDMVMGAGGVLASVVGAYMAIQNRLTALEGSQEILKGDLGHVAADVAKLSERQEKLVRREYRREGAAMARTEPSGVQDIPTARLHVGTDTTI